MNPTQILSRKRGTRASMNPELTTQNRGMTRRNFLTVSAGAAVATGVAAGLTCATASAEVAERREGSAMRVGLDGFSYGLALGGNKYELKRPRMTMREFLEHAHAVGAEGFILSRGFVRKPEQWGPEFLDAMRTRADELGMYLELGIGTPENLGKAIDDAVRLGASTIRALVAPWLAGDRRNYQGNWQEMIDRAVVKLRAEAPKAAHNNIRIGLEDHLDLTAEELLQVIERVDSPQVGVCFDTGNPLGMMEDPLETARKLAPHVVTTHLKDWKLGWTQRGYQFAACPLGEGVVDNVGIIRLLAPMHPDLHLNIESPAFQRFEMPIFQDDYWRGFPDLRASHLARFIHFMKRTVGDARADDWRTPLEQGWPEEKLLKHEDDMVRQAVTYVRRELLPLTDSSK